jgi:hypothetical protein
LVDEEKLDPRYLVGYFEWCIFLKFRNDFTLDWTPVHGRAQCPVMAPGGRATIAGSSHERFGSEITAALIGRVDRGGVLTRRSDGRRRYHGTALQQLSLGRYTGEG